MQLHDNQTAPFLSMISCLAFLGKINAIRGFGLQSEIRARLHKYVLQLNRFLGFVLCSWSFFMFTRARNCSSSALVSYISTLQFWYDWVNSEPLKKTLQ